jgi:hypothetical protein
MARLSYAARKNLPDSAFALPKDRKLPLTNARGNLDRKHIGNAASRLSAMRRRHTISAGKYLAAHHAIERAKREMGMGRANAAENPAGDFVHEHPWMTFFLGLAAINIVGWLAFLGIAAAQGGGASSSGATKIAYNPQTVSPIPAGSPAAAAQVTTPVGSSLALVDPVATGTESQVPGTSDNLAVVAPAPGVVGGFVAVSPGTATLTSTGSGNKCVVTVVLGSGTAGVGGKPKALPVTFVPRLLRFG